MLDLAVAVLHTFTVLLPQTAKKDDKLHGRIPALAAAVLYSSKETTGIILKTLLSLVSSPEGAAIFVHLDPEQISPLLEISPENSEVMSILQWSWQLGPSTVHDSQARDHIRQNIEQCIQALVSAFHGTDGTVLLEFLPILSSLELDLIPKTPTWLDSVVKLIRKLCTNRPSAQGRSAYTNCAGTLLLLYPETMANLLFKGEPSNSSKPFSFLFISLILVDIRATLPSLLDKLNNDDFVGISQRLTSAMDILTAFIGHLISWMEKLDNPEDDTATSTSDALNLEPDLMIKLSKSIAETVSVTMEFLRDRWDASVAGAQGLHRDARSGQAHTSSGSHMTVAWDAKVDNATADPLTLAAVRVAAMWLRDDDGDVLREQGAGLVDMTLELYQSSASGNTQSDYRLPVLTAFEGILRTPVGIETFKSENGWFILAKDLLDVLARGTSDVVLASRIVFVLDLVLENEGVTPESWMDVVTGIAAFDLPDGLLQDQAFVDLLVDVMWLVANLLQNAGQGMRQRYMYTTSAIRGIAKRLGRIVDPTSKSASELAGAVRILERV